MRTIMTAGCVSDDKLSAGIPIAAVAMLGTVYLIRYAYRAACLNIPKARRGDHLPQMVSTAIILYRILYLYLTRTSFDVVCVSIGKCLHLFIVHMGIMLVHAVELHTNHSACLQRRC